MSHNNPFRVLVFSKTSSYRHDSIPAGISAIRELARRSKLFTVDASEEPESAITSSSLDQYAVVVLLQCTGTFLTSDQIQTLQSFVRAGGGVVGIHGAAAGMPNDEWYGKLLGAHFDSHPEPELGTVLVEDDNSNHFILDKSGGRSAWTDEWYNFRTHPRDNTNLKILLKGDTTTFQGSKMGEDHPLAWCQEFDGGRSFYTALGHFEEAYRDAWFLEQLQRAILWAGKRENDT